MPDPSRIDMTRHAGLLKRMVEKRAGAPGEHAVGISGVALYRRDQNTEAAPTLYQPRIIKMVQGNKRVTVGGEEYRYGEDNILVTGVDIPGISVICEATPERPSLALAIDLDTALLAQLSVETADTHPRLVDGEPGRGLFVQPMDAGVLDALVRLAELFDRPERAVVLAPLIVREIHFLLLTGPNGHLLRSMHTHGSQSNQVARAVAWLKRNLTAAVGVEGLAEKVHMAPSTFHRHFKEVTGLSPIQYQKRLRLHEAQRLMLADDLDAGQASAAVGYESLSQFNREYKRLFGAPPRRDVVRRRQSGEPRLPATPVLPMALPTF